MRASRFKDIGWSLEDIMRDPARQAQMLDITEAAAYHAGFEQATFVSRRLWSAVGGGTPRVGDQRLKELCWTASFALCGLTRLSEEFRPFARVVCFRMGVNASRIHPELVIAVVVYRAIGCGNRALLLLFDEL